MSICAAEPIWEVVRVYSDIYRYEDKRIIVVNSITLSLTRNYINHVVTINFPKCSSIENIKKENLEFRYRDNMQTKVFEILKLRKITYEELTQVLQYYNLPNLRKFEVIVPNFVHSMVFKSPETRSFGILHKTEDEDVYTDVSEMAHFGMDVYLSCVVEHKNALSDDSENY
jgi:hypothetical protein